jgi:hypothetical protein
MTTEVENMSHGPNSDLIVNMSAKSASELKIWVMDQLHVCQVYNSQIFQTRYINLIYMINFMCAKSACLP